MAAAMKSVVQGRQISDQEIDRVHNCVEQCIMNYMSQKEAIDTLTIQANIEPAFTRLVWERLEKENQDFFKAYYVKLLLKDQIVEFNRLLLQQLELMNQSEFTRIANGLNSDGYHASSSNTAFYDGYHASSTQEICTPNAAQSSSYLKTEDVQQLINVLNNNGMSMTQPFARGTFDGWSVHGREIDASPNMLSQNRNVGMAQPMMNWQIAKSEAVSPFSSVESNAVEAEPPEDHLLDMDAACFLEQYHQQPFTAESWASANVERFDHASASASTSGSSRHH